MNVLSQFSSFFTGGGPFMFVILGAGVAILALALERAWVIGRASAWNSAKLGRDVTQRVNRGDSRGAISIATKVDSPAGRVARAILECPDRSEEGLMNAADAEASLVLPPLSRRLPHLNLLGNTATLLGLLGTIFGLTTAFAAVGAADPSQRSAFLAAGISQALNTTAFGLIVAVPALLVHGVLSARVERMMDSVDEITVRLVRALRSTATGEAAATATATATATETAAKETATPPVTKANGAASSAPTTPRVVTGPIHPGPSANAGAPATSAATVATAHRPPQTTR